MKLLRAVPLALAAFASLATSAFEEVELHYDVYQVAPKNNDLDVSPAALPTLGIAGDAADPAWLRLEMIGDVQVPGSAHVEGDQLVFVPTQLLAPGEYRLVVDRQEGMYDGWDTYDDENEIWITFTVRPPGELGGGWIQAGNTVDLAFTSAVDADSLLPRVACLDDAGEEIAIRELVAVTAATFELTLADPAASCRIEDGVLDHHGFPILGLPASF